MPASKAPNSLLAALGDRGRKAHEAHKADETQFDQFSELPPGIEGGIAQLDECKFDRYKKGKNAGQWYFSARGTVKFPKVHVDANQQEIPVFGKHTSIMEPLYDTPDRSRKTIDDHLDWIYNELRKLGVDTANMQFEELEATAKALIEAAPHFKFRTWKGEATKEFPNLRTQANWNGVCEFDDTADPAAGVQESGRPPSGGGGTTTSAASGGEDEIANLVAAATDNDDSAAQEKLKQMAKKAGASEQAIKEAQTWADVAAMIGGSDEQGASTGGGDTPPEGDSPPEEDFLPAKEDIFKYQPRDKEGKPLRGKNKQVLKSRECEVTAVNTKNKTVDLIDQIDKKTVYKGVPWDRLESAEEEK